MNLVRLIYVSSKERIHTLYCDYDIKKGSIREGDYLFKIETSNVNEFSEIESIVKINNPFLKIISKNSKNVILKVIPEAELLESLAGLDLNDSFISLFLNKLVSYFGDTKDLVWNLKDRVIDFNKSPLIMGILNITPDSFSDGGLYFDKNRAVEHALNMETHGADIIDVGGESTRPGAQKISEDEELKRIIPVIESIRKNSNILISVDTYKSNVAETAFLAGADIINDISGARFDEKMLGITAKFKCPYIVMHIQGTPQNMQNNPSYSDVQNDVYNFLLKKSEEISSYNDGMVIIDPGIGFGKTVDHNLKLLRDLADFTFIGKPILIGVSRKSFIGKILNLKVNERFVGTMVSEFYASLKKVNILRVHDVQETVQAKKMLNHILAA